MRRLLLASVISASAASFAGAQDAVVIGQAVVKETRSPLGYSVVTSSRSPALLTGESGKFLLRDLGPGPVKITVKHIGFGARDTTITVAGHDTVRLEIALSQLVIQLPKMLVSGACTNEMPRETPPAVLAELFDQVRQNAERYRLLATAQPFALKVQRIRGYRLPDGRVAGEMTDTVVRDAFPAGPYEPKLVIRKSVLDKSQWAIAVPELPDLADTAFLNNHCFRYAGKTKAMGDSVIRVDYEPVPWLNKEVDISGSLYLNPESYQLVSTVTALNRIPQQFWGTGMQTLSVTARFSEIVPGVPVLDEWVLESKYRSKRQPPTVETGQIFAVVFTNPVKPDTASHRR